MPEYKAKSKSKKDVNKAVGKNIDAMAHGEHHGDRVKKHGKETAHKMEVAAAERIARGKDKTESKEKMSKPKPSNDKFAPSSGSSKKQSRNKGRR